MRNLRTYTCPVCGEDNTKYDDSVLDDEDYDVSDGTEVTGYFKCDNCSNIISLIVNFSLTPVDEE